MFIFIVRYKSDLFDSSSETGVKMFDKRFDSKIFIYKKTKYNKYIYETKWVMTENRTNFYRI